MKLPIIIQPELEEKQFAFLQKKWRVLNENLASENEALFEQLVNMYQDSTRTYHNLSHIYSLIKLSDHFFARHPERKLLEWAIWFHDAIYSSTSKQNERLSADLARRKLVPLMPSIYINKIMALILSTAKHQSILDEPINDWMLDFDLAVLASPPELYAKYVRGIRQEYRWYPNFLYRRGRKKVLQSFVEREHLYFTDYFRQNFEAQARVNLESELRG